MAGSYADPTSWRMALDRDGSKVVWADEAGKLSTVSLADMAAAADDNSDTRVTMGGLPQTIWVAVVFPELRDIDGYLLIVNSTSAQAVEVSTNTTNGQDGTWAQIAAGYVPATSSVGWRTAAASGTALAVRAIRFRGGPFQTYNLRSVHVYGETAPGENPDRLVVWSATADTKIPPAVLDWGNVPRGSSDDRVIRIKNLSGSKTAANVRVSFDIMTDGVPTVPGQFLASYGGGAFLAQVNIGTLAPGAISGPVTLRRVTPSNAQLGLFAPRVSAVADSFA